MTECKSFAQAVAQLYDGYHEVTKKVLSHAAGGAVVVSTGNVAAGLQAQQQALEALDKVSEVVEKLEAGFQKLIGKTSVATLGPRCLRLDTWEKGTVISSGDRMFLTAVSLDVDSAKVRIEERGGKGKVRVRICSFDEKGRHKELRELTLNDDRAEKKDKDEKTTVSLSGVEGCWISVLLDGRSLGNTFKYRLMLDT